MDLWSLYELMKKSRLFEEAVTQLWRDGLISGEMHLGTGEEAIIAGIVSHLQAGDAMAVDHRGSAAFLMRGVDPVLLLREMLGLENGLCGGQGGHMHLYSKEHLSASSGIVGAVGPAAVGFAMAAQYLRPGSIVVAFFGEGAMNQGMLMESINLASVWNLPVLFVCKDDGWAITTEPEDSTRGELRERAQGLGAQYWEADGLDVQQVWEAADQAIKQLRTGSAPIFLCARCIHLEGHFLGLPLLRIIRDPIKELPTIIVPLLKSFLRVNGSSLRERVAGMQAIISTILETLRDPRQQISNDPVVQTRSLLMSNPVRLEELERHLEEDNSAIVAAVLAEVKA